VLVSLIEQSVAVMLAARTMKLGDIDRHPITERVGEFRNL
jgi:hypothetical protein